MKLHRTLVTLLTFTIFSTACISSRAFAQSINRTGYFTVETTSTVVQDSGHRVAILADGLTVYDLEFEIHNTDILRRMTRDGRFVLKFVIRRTSDKSVVFDRGQSMTIDDFTPIVRLPFGLQVEDCTSEVDAHVIKADRTYTVRAESARKKIYFEYVLQIK